MALVQLRVPDDRLEEWDEYVEENPEYDDRSDLIRTSVERTISDSKDETEDNDGIDTEVIEALDRLEGLLYDVEASIDEVKADLVDEDQLENIVSNRSYRAVEYVLEDNDLLDEGHDDGE